MRKLESQSEILDKLLHQFPLMEANTCESENSCF
jgi:hypothetical protein